MASPRTRFDPGNAARIGVGSCEISTALCCGVNWAGASCLVASLVGIGAIRIDGVAFTVVGAVAAMGVGFLTGASGVGVGAPSAQFGEPTSPVGVALYRYCPVRDMLAPEPTSGVVLPRTACQLLVGGALKLTLLFGRVAELFKAAAAAAEPAG